MHASGMMCSFHRCGKTRPQGREVTCPHPHSESVAKVRQEGRSPDPGALCVFALLCVCVSLCVCYLLSHVRLGWEFSSKSTGMGFHSLLQGITVCGSTVLAGERNEHRGVK